MSCKVNFHHAHLHRTNSINNLKITIEVTHNGITATRCDCFNGKLSNPLTILLPGHSNDARMTAQRSSDLSVEEAEDTRLAESQQVADLLRTHVRHTGALFNDPQENSNANVHFALLE